MTTIFISHIHEEAAVAMLLKNWIEETFLGQINVFVSADERDIVIGDEWFEKISDALNSAKVVLLLCSPSSIKRPWISFEAGWAWSKRVALAPICHSGLSITELPRPLASRQAVNLQEADSFSRLIRALGKHHGITKFPRIQDAEFQSELASILKEHLPQKIVAADTDSVKREMEFFDERNRILQAIEKSPRALQSEFISHATSISLSIVKLLLARLDEDDLVWTSLSIGGPTTYGITDKGREHLLSCGLLS